jgi:hypothetical protein
MDIFLSWSGERSKAAAEILKKWIPTVLRGIKPWQSRLDIKKGSDWHEDLRVQLEKTKAGIVCVTASSLESPWLLFESGALSKSVSKTLLCPLLLDGETLQLEGPLASFQATKATRDEILSLLLTLNGALRGKARISEAKLQKVFSTKWPKLEAELKALPKEAPIRRGRGAKQREAHREKLRPVIKKVLESMVRSLELSLTDSNVTIRGYCHLYNEKLNQLEHYVSVSPGSWHADQDMPVRCDDAGFEKFVICKAFKKSQPMKENLGKDAVENMPFEIWQEMKCVLAAPIRDFDTPTPVPLGVVDFNANRTLEEVHFHDKRAMDMCRTCAETIYAILKEDPITPKRKHA